MLSEDSILSKSTTLFGRRIQIIGRSCGVSNTINSSSTPSGNFLFENYSFTFDGEIEITENCPVNGSMISENWTFKSVANITLPLSCSINSSWINCWAVKLHSSQAKKIKLKEQRMQIIMKENIEQIKATLNTTDFVRNPLNEKYATIPIWSRPVGGLNIYKWIIVTTATIPASILGSIVIYRICSKQNHSQNAMSINIENNLTNTSPTAPVTTLAHTRTNPMEDKNTLVFFYKKLGKMVQPQVS